MLKSSLIQLMIFENVNQLSEKLLLAVKMQQA